MRERNSNAVERCCADTCANIVRFSLKTDFWWKASCRKYKLISHPDNTNPFPGPFMNYRAVIQLEEVTRGGLAFMKWTGEFDTEPQVSDPAIRLSMKESTILKLADSHFGVLSEHMGNTAFIRRNDKLSKFTYPQVLHIKHLCVQKLCAALFCREVVNDGKIFLIVSCHFRELLK